MRSSLRSRLRIAAAALVLAFAGGLACNTPSVPLPPPLLTSLSFSAGPAAGIAIMHGQPTPRHADARFYVFNLSGHEGVIVTAAGDGSFTSGPFAASEGDAVEIYFDTPAGDRSQALCTAIAFGTPLLSSTCISQ
jgi:hypothetical protein